MDDPRQVDVIGRDGPLGVVALDDFQAEDRDPLLHLADGRVVRVPADLFIRQADGSLYLPLSRDQFNAQGGPSEDDLMVIPVIVESAEVTRKRTTKARVRVHKQVHQREQQIDEPTFEEEVHVEHVPVNQVINEPPKVRYEGHTMIIPVLEEVLVVEKRLMLKEEVRVTRRRKTTRQPQTVNLRSEEVNVERLEPDQS